MSDGYSVVDPRLVLPNEGGQGLDWELAVVRELREERPNLLRLLTVVRIGRHHDVLLEEINHIMISSELGLQSDALAREARENVYRQKIAADARMPDPSSELRLRIAADAVQSRLGSVEGVDMHVGPPMPGTPEHDHLHNEG